MLNYFSISGFFILVINLALAIIISLAGKLRIHRVWAFVNYSISFWGLGILISGSSPDHTISFLGWKIFNMGIVLIAALYYHVIHLFCKLRSNRFLIYCYLQGAFFIILAIFTNFLFGNKLYFAFNQFYYFKASPWHHLLMLNFSIIVGLSFYELYKYIRNSSGIANTQAKYLFFAMICGFGGGLNTAPAAWGYNIYPYGQIFVCLYGSLVTYAIFKYELMNIRVAITRLGIFLLVYSIVLGVPFGLLVTGQHWLEERLQNNWYWVPMLSLLILATAGPFIYFYLQLKAENALLQRDKRIQEMLKSAFAGITKIKDQHKLLQIISRLLRKILRIRVFAFYIYDQQNALFTLKLVKENKEIPDSFDSSNPLVKNLIKKNSPLLLEELHYLIENDPSKDQALSDIYITMKDLKASIIIPTTSVDNLSGFIVLGDRDRHEQLSPNLINILSIIGGQVGLALENTLFIETKEKGLNEEFERRRLESLGTLCNSISHQMNNRFHAIMQRSSVPLDIYSEGKYKELSREDLISLVEIFGKTTERILAISADGGKITETIQNFSKANIEFSVVNFSDAVARSLDLVSLKYPKFDFTLKKEFPENVLLWGIEAPIQDILFNALDNSCFAMKSKLATDTSYSPQIIVRGKTNHSIFEFEIEDNGTGIKKENLSKVMDPMFTTKSHKDGTGMGTTVMLQFIQNHAGEIRYESEFGLWTKVIISLPLATEEQKKLTKNV